MIVKTYCQLMGEQKSVITLKIDTAEPVELRDFVGAFTSLANEFERFIKDAYPAAKADPHIFVREVRSGCIEADMVAGLLPIAVSSMEQLLILEDFVRRWGKRFLALRTNKIADDELRSSSELKDWADAARSIASDPTAAHRLLVTTFEDDERKIRAKFEFTAPEARTALQNIEDRKRLLAKPDLEPRRRVLMIFTRTDVHDATINKKSGERVMINEILDKEKPVMYASENAEHEIRDLIREADENVYKRGFVVDVLVQKDGDRIIAYSVTAFHNVLDLDD